MSELLNLNFPDETYNALLEQLLVTVDHGRVHLI